MLRRFTTGLGNFRPALGESLKIPVLAGLPVGHQPDNFTLPIGAKVAVDSKNNLVYMIDTVFPEP